MFTITFIYLLKQKDIWDKNGFFFHCGIKFLAAYTIKCQELF